MQRELGIFKSFWDDGHPRHLQLMNLSGDVEIAFAKIDGILKNNSTEKVLHDLLIILSGPDWRPQLVFCIALLKLHDESKSSLLPHLWKKIEADDTWLLPQLTATASIIDHQFTEKASEILRKKNPEAHFDSHQALIYLNQASARGDKSYIAIRWKERLLNLMAAGKI